MNSRKLFLGLLCVSVAGCGGGGYGGSAGYSPPPQAPTPPSTTGASFTSWSKTTVYAKPAADVPEDFEALSFNFDGNENPEAYAELLPPN